MTHRRRFRMKNPVCEQSDVPLLPGLESTLLYLEEAL